MSLADFLCMFYALNITTIGYSFLSKNTTQNVVLREILRLYFMILAYSEFLLQRREIALNCRSNKQKLMFKFKTVLLLLGTVCVTIGKQSS